MIQMNSEQLITNLMEESKNHIHTVEQLKVERDEFLNWRPNTKSWNILECIEHLNRYAEFYNKEIEYRLSLSKKPPEKFFKSGWIGNYFVRLIRPNEKKVKKMKTLKDMDPRGVPLKKEILETFLHQQTILLKLLQKSRNHSLNKVKTSISITKWITLKLGDTLRFVVNHNGRHILQIKHIEMAYKKEAIQ